MDNYVTQQDFERYKRFVTMQAQSLFAQIEQLRDRIEHMEPIKPIPKRRKEMLDRIVEDLASKVSFLEGQLNKRNK